MTDYTEAEIAAALKEDGESFPAEESVATETLRVKGPQRGPGRKPSAFRQSDYNPGDVGAKNGTEANTTENISSAFSVPNGRLFNQSELSKGFRELKTEKYEHRIIGYLKAQGMTNVEIAKQTGYTASYISQVIRLPWVSHLIIEEIRKNGQDAVQATLESNVLETVQFIIDTVHNEKAATRDRIAAAKEHLNRVYGMPTQPILHKEEVDMDSLPDSELARIANRGRVADDQATAVSEN